jgi:hypothetical protein
MSQPPKHILSKSTFLYGCQCPKRLWLHKNRPDLRDEMDDEQQSIFQQGTNVGLLARELFPGGVDASPATPFLYQQSVADTARYIQEGQTIIYEAAFQFEGLLCAVDLLVNENGKWYAYEVKSTNSVKEAHVFDTSFQYYVLKGAGMKLEDFYITHLNRDYIRNGALDVAQLFVHESVLDRILDNQEEIAEKEQDLKTMLQKKEMPEMEVGKQCNSPYPCDFQGFCYEGIESEEIDYGEPYINTEAIAEFLDQLEYPVYHMDFESWRTAVPEYDGHWPYRQVCFQYSVHVQQTPGAEPEHHYYLAERVDSPTETFLQNLLGVLGKKGTILVYCKGFESPRLLELVREHPHYEKAVENVIDRIIDLMAPFRKHYRLPEMEGSYSIKKVLPALVPELSYADLAIANGGDASAAFINLREETDPEKIKATREALLEYCGLDTLAMVKILEKLNECNN